MVKLDEFRNFEIRIGKVIDAGNVEGTVKMLKLIIDFGNEKRQVITGMAEFFEPSHFIGKEVPVLLNIEFKKFRGLESQGMILAADVSGKPVLLHPESEVPPGSIVK